MKNQLHIDIDTDRKQAVIIGKPPGIPRPRNSDEAASMIIVDMATLCEGICTLIHVADQNGMKSSAESVRDCIKHIEHGFADAGYIGKTVK